MFINYHSAKTKDDSAYFDPKLAHVILSSADKRKFIIKQIADTLQFYKLQGLNVDFEELNEKGNEPLTQFQKELYEALHPRGCL